MVLLHLLLLLLDLGAEDLHFFPGIVVAHFFTVIRHLVLARKKAGSEAQKDDEGENGARKYGFK